MMPANRADLDRLQLTGSNLRDTVDGVRWGPPRAFWRTKRELESTLLGHALRWEAYAADLHLPLPRLVSNLVAEADAGDVPAYRLALEALAQLAPQPWSEIQAGLSAVLPPISPEMGFLAAILDGRSPDTEAVARHFGESPLRGLGWCLLHAEGGKPRTAMEAADRVRCYLDASPDVDCAELSNTLVRVWKRGLPELDAAALGSWTPQLRTAAMVDHQTRKMLLAPSLLTELAAASPDFPHSPAWWRLRIDPALAALNTLAPASRFGANVWDLPACGLGQLEYVGTMLEKVLNSGPRRRFPPLPPANLPMETLELLQPAEIRTRLAYLAAPSNQRLADLMAAPPNDRKWLVTNTTTESLADAILEDEDEDRVAAALSELDQLDAAAPILLEALGSVTKCPTQGQRSFLIKAILDRLDDVAIVTRLAESSNETIQLVAAELAPDRAAKILFAQAIDDRVALFILTGARSGTLQAPALRSAPELSRIVGQALAYGLDEADHRALRRLEPLLEDEVDRRLEDLFGDDGLRESTFAALCTQLSPTLVERMAGDLRNAVDRHGRRLWPRYLRRLRRRGEGVADALLPVVAKREREPPEQAYAPLLEAVHCYPEAFWPRAMAELWPTNAPWPYAFLNAVFDSPELARQVLQRQAALGIDADPLDLIPTVRERFAGHPARAAAYELSLAFSLVDARYLLWLARRAGHNADHRSPGTAFDALYHVYQLPKRSGGHRPITAPQPRLKRLQRRLLDRGFSQIDLHPAAHGFRSGHSIATNAQPHVGKEMVVNVDIEGFFPNTRYALIVEACKQLAGGRLSKAAVMLAADICSYGGGLPTGAPTSPAIANIVLRPVDHAITTAAARFDITYTRYADDLTFSGAGETHRILPFVGRVLADFGYRLEDKKTNIFRRGRRQVVTGLVVNEKVNVPRQVRRRLRAAVHRRQQGQVPHWHDKPLDDHRLGAYLAYLNVANPSEAARYRAQLDGTHPSTPEDKS